MMMDIREKQINLYHAINDLIKDAKEIEKHLDAPYNGIYFDAKMKLIRAAGLVAKAFEDSNRSKG